MQKSFWLGAGLLLSVWANMPVAAQVPGTGMQMQSQVWGGTLAGGGAHAECKIQTTDGVTCKLIIDATGLVPRGAYTLWSDAGGSLLPIGKDITPMVADRKGTLHKSPQLNSVPQDREVHVLLRQELGAGRFGPSIEGVLRKQ